MLTSDSFTSDPDQVEHLIRWWISQSRTRYHRVRRRGTVRDFINEVWCRLLFSFRDGRSVEDCSLATAVINHCEWEKSKYINMGDRIHDSSRITRNVKPSDRISDGKDAEQSAIAADLDRAIATILRTLTFREAVIIRAHFGLLGDSAMTCEDIGARLKISRARVFQIERKGLRKVQHYRRANKLKPFLDDGHERQMRKARERRNPNWKSSNSQALYDELTKND